jgi:hypothetical protein
MECTCQMVDHVICCGIDVLVQVERDAQVQKLQNLAAEQKLELEDLRKFKAGLTAAFSTAAVRDLVGMVSQLTAA